MQKNKPVRKQRSKETQSNATGLVVKIGRRDFDYDKVRSATLHAPLIDVNPAELSLFKECMANEQVDMTTNAIDDGIIRIVRVRPEFYEVISGKNKIIAAIFEAKKAGAKIGDKLQTLKARLASWKHLNPCEVPPKALSAEELKTSLAQLGDNLGATVRVPKSNVHPIGTGAALLQPPKREPKVVAQPSGKFGRIFGGNQAAA